MSILVHGGNLGDIALLHGIDIKKLVDFSSNLNPIGPPKGLLEYLNSNINDLLLLPEYDSLTCISFISSLMGIDKNRIVAGNGTTEFIHRLPETLKPDKVLIVGPTYSDYEKACNIRGIEADYFFLDESDNFFPDIETICKKVKDYDLVFICNPNNPTGQVLKKDLIKYLCLENKDTFFVIDETYLPFEENFLEKTMSGEKLDNLIVLLSFSKIFSLPGLRLGFMVIPQGMDKKIYDLPWKVNSISSGVCSFMKKDLDLLVGFLNKTSNFIKNEKNRFFNDEIINKNLRLINDNNIYTLAKIVKEGEDSSKIFDHFLKKEMVIRDCYNIKGLGVGFIRFSFKDSENNQALLKEFQRYFNG